MDVSQYLEIFIDESNEHLQNLSDGIMILEKEPDNSDTINEIFRAAHSLKGMAGTMGYKRMQNLTHDMENVFSEVRNGNIKVDSRMVDVLFQCLDALEQYVNNIQETSDEGTDDNEPIIKALNSFIVNNEDKGVLPEEANKEEAPAEEKKEESGEVVFYSISLARVTAFFPYFLRIESSAASSFFCFSGDGFFGKSALAFVLFAEISEKSRSNKESWTGSFSSTSLVVRIPNRRTGC